MHKQSSIVGGIILILVGLFFLATQFLPEELSRFLDFGNQWPLILVGLGGIFLVGALLAQPELAVPGSIVGGLGLLMYYQNLTNSWESWAYAWPLILGFVGFGIFLMHLLQKNPGRGLQEGGRLMAISLALFLFFGLMFSGLRGVLWPVALIGLGLFLMARNVWRGRKR